ncbi:MAG: OmpP1/FadL family transporter [Cryomorphaceae bacterium]
MRQTTITAALLCVAGTIVAQNDADVQRYTTHLPPGTARFGAMGGAFTALGGDMSAMHINPAGVAVFRFNEISLTPLVETRDISTSLAGQASSGNHAGFAIGNAGFVLSNELDDPYWKSVNVGLSINRLNTYNDQITSNAVIPLGSTLMQSFANDAFGTEPADLPFLGSGLAYDGFVIDPVDGTSPQEYEGGVSQGEMLQRHEANTSGRMNEFAITVGGNYDDRLYIGGALGIMTSYYDLESETYEEATSPGTGDLRNYTFRENLNVEGFGVNIKAGVIYRFENGLRIGASVQTPTALRMQDNYGQSMVVNRDGQERFSSSPETDFIEYRVRTPWRYTFGVAGVLAKKIILSGQYEFVNFAGGEYRPANRRSGLSSFLDDANVIIQENFRAQHAFRGGIEFRLNKNISARGGAAYFPNVVPINEPLIPGSMDQLNIGGGFGYREKTWNLDLSYSFSRFNEPYRVSGAGEVQQLQNTLGIISLTFGLRI